MADLAMPTRKLTKHCTQWCTGAVHGTLGDPVCTSESNALSSGVAIWATWQPGRDVEIVIDAPAKLRLTIDEATDLRIAIELLLEKIQGIEAEWIVAPRTES